MKSQDNWPPHWDDLGEETWSATAPNGQSLTYAGERFSLFERGYTRLSNTLTLGARGQARIELLREGGFDRLAKRLGYAVELQTGDAAFDRRIYLATDDGALVRTLADRPDIRQAVLDLFDHGVRRLTVRPEGWSARLDEPMTPDRRPVTLSALALRLCALAELWPQAGPAPEPTGRSALRWLGLAWFWVVVAAVMVRALWGERAWMRQLETFAQPDWLGMALLVLAAAGPFALLGGRRATSHRILAGMVLGALALLPFSDHLLEGDLNRLGARGREVVPAVVTALRIDPDRQWSKGYLLTATVEDRQLDWGLSPDEGRLAVAGKLCVAGVVEEGSRGLRYIQALRSWTCRPGESSPVPPPTETPPQTQ